MPIESSDHEEQSEHIEQSRHVGQSGFFNEKPFARSGLAVGCALACNAFLWTGAFVFLFLLPIAIAAFFGNAKITWAAGILAAAFNVLVSLWLLMYRSEDIFFLQWNVLYFTLIGLVFTWIHAPLGKYWLFKAIPIRMIAGAALCTVVYLPFILVIRQDSESFLMLGRQLGFLNTVPSSLEETGFTSEDFVLSVINIVLRGGIPLSCLVLWWINRQLAYLIYRLFRRGEAVQTETILNFHAPFFLVWVLSLSLAAILLGKIGNIDLLEICGWNFLVLSAILFFVQGGAIMLHFLMRFPPLPRIIINVGIVLLFFKPGVNAVLLGLLVLLGVAENWVPFRAPKQ